MDVILHIGAHRCASTSFRNYLRLNHASLTRQGMGFWGTRRTRAGLFHGILPKQFVPGDSYRRAVGRVRMNLERSAGRGLGTLLVSDENMLGTIRENVRLGELYCGAGERLARFNEAFDGRIRHVMLNIRSHETYWASALGFGLTRGQNVPAPAAFDRLARLPRTWRDVVTDVACAIPDATIWVAPFETFAGRPEAQLSAIAGINAPMAHARERLNATPHLPQLRDLGRALAQDWQLPKGDGRWQPFAPTQIADLREAYGDDLMWLAGGAEGLARLMPDPDKKKAAKSPPKTDMTRGRRNGQQERHMARAR